MAMARVCVAMAHVHVCVCVSVCVGGSMQARHWESRLAIWSKKAESSQKDNVGSSPVVLWESAHEGSPVCSCLRQAGLQ